VDAFAADLNSHLYGNPHSHSTPSEQAGRRIDEVREQALRFFGADPEEFDLIFVANATAAIKLVMDGFRDYRKRGSGMTPKFMQKWTKRSFHYYYHRDSHTSLVGLREFSSKQYCFHDDAEVEAWINKPGPVGASMPLTLFAYPGQSNMNGRRLPLTWPAKLKKHGSNAFTLLDAAALATTSQLHLSRDKPDFTAISFYKIFGFPDLGALIVRKSTAARILNARRYFGGGTVDMVVSIDEAWHAKRTTNLHSAHEDGTLPFHNIIALGQAMAAMDRVYGGIAAVGKHTASLAAELYSQLSSLRHESNGKQLIMIYMDAGTVYGNAAVQGATLAFNVMRANGSFVGYEDVEKAADAEKIYLRSGGLCNPGGVATYLGWRPSDMKDAYKFGHRCSKPIQGMMGRATGVVRVSFGACSSMRDIERLVDFLKATYIERVEPGKRSTDVSVELGSDGERLRRSAIAEDAAALSVGTDAALDPARTISPAVTLPAIVDSKSFDTTTTYSIASAKGAKPAVVRSMSMSTAKRWARTALARKEVARATIVTVEEVRV
jgi:molybdenum cofactor sulfurtransferase